MKRFDRRNMPPCFSVVEEWKEWNRLAIISDHRGNYCSDCLPAFKQQMMKEGRCKFTGTVFNTVFERDRIIFIGVRK